MRRRRISSLQTIRSIRCYSHDTLIFSQAAAKQLHGVFRDGDQAREGLVRRRRLHTIASSEPFFADPEPTTILINGITEPRAIVRSDNFTTDEDEHKQRDGTARVAAAR